MMCWSMKVYIVAGSALFNVAAMLLTLSAASPLHAQESTGPTVWEPTGLPALNYDSDEGFGYGVLFELYNYGDGGYSPYRFTIQPTVFLTTGGRRQFNLFFDAPHLLPEGWRIDALLRSLPAPPGGSRPGFRRSTTTRTRASDTASFSSCTTTGTVGTRRIGSPYSLRCF